MGVTARWAVVVGLCLASLGLMPRAAQAQVFPDDPEDWVPLRCRGGVMVDAARDESGALDDRDIVGDEDFPAGFRSADDDFLYLRLRLDADPAQGTELRPFFWAFGFDTDGDRATYEVLVLVDGVAQEVLLYQNTETQLRNDPTDPPDEPPLAVYPFDTNGRVVPTNDGSNFNGDEDFFLEVAIPFEDLADLDVPVVLPASRISTFAATSGADDQLTGDFACIPGGGGDVDLEVIFSDGIVVDAELDADLDGFSDEEEIEAGTDPDDPNSFPEDVLVPGPGGLSLEGGGPGCSAAGTRPSPAAGGAGAALLLLVWLALLFERRTARAPTTPRPKKDGLGMPASSRLRPWRSSRPGGSLPPASSRARRSRAC